MDAGVTKSSMMDNLGDLRPPAVGDTEKRNTEKRI
jgi:hypothetical protein